MSEKIRLNMLSEFSAEDSEKFILYSVLNAARRAVDEANSSTRGTLIALLGIDVGIYPIKAVMNLGDDEFPNDAHCELLTGLADNSIVKDEIYTAIGFDALRRVDPDISLARIRLFSDNPVA
jgi:hypothetical protein